MSTCPFFVGVYLTPASAAAASGVACPPNVP
jgi:hypothetical protein